VSGRVPRLSLHSPRHGPACGIRVGALAAVYVAALFVEQRICDEGTCQHVAGWGWIVFGAVALVGLGYRLGPWWPTRMPPEIRRALRQPPK
jgi:hypothetical protein